MKPIEFRAWHEEYRKMFEFHDLIMFEYTLEDLQYDKPEIFMQFTGLLEKNGKKIFEGDIVKWSRSETIFKVIWKYSGWNFERITGSYCYPIFDNTAREVEVIGNIYENPELMEVK